MANTSPWHHLYNTKRWKHKRREQLERQPLCAFCMSMGKIVRASVADHVIAHKGDESLFFDGETQSLCKHCHDRHKQRQEKSGWLAGHDESGIPVDPGHHWS